MKYLKTSTAREAEAICDLAKQNGELKTQVRELAKKIADANLQKESLKKTLEDQYREVNTSVDLAVSLECKLGFCDGLDFALQELDKWKA
jgi:phage shock protein A